MKPIIVKNSDYVDVNTKKPKEGVKVWVLIPTYLSPRIAVYRKGKFLDVSDESNELQPTKWKYSTVPFFF